MSIIVRGEGLEAQDLMSIVEEFASIHTAYGKAIVAGVKLRRSL
jgi:hypothetical protein